MNARTLSHNQRLLLLTLAIGNLVVLCLLASAVALSMHNLPSVRQVAPVAALPSPATQTSSPIPTEIPTPQPTNTRVVSREFYNQPTADKIIEQVVAIRELDAAAGVSFSMLSQEEMAEEMRSLYGSEEIQKGTDLQWTLYQTLGLISEDATISGDEAEASVANLAGLYVPEEKHIYIITKRVNMSAEEETVFAHEYTHALQDQHLNLESYLADISSTDADLAARSLVEGDATVVMAFYAYGNTTQAEWEYLAYQASFAEEPGLEELEGVSERAGRMVGFPYQEGASFVMDMLFDGWWDEVNAAYANPPASTEQVLYPEKYRAQDDPPQEVHLPPPPDKSWQPVLEDTLGEFVISVHLDEFLDDPERAAEAAAGWGGDRIAVWQDPDGRRLTLWQTVWDSQAEAAEFEEAYRALIPARFETVTSTGDGWWEGDGVAVGLLRQGEWVVIAWGPDRATIEAALMMARVEVVAPAGAPGMEKSTLAGDGVSSISYPKQGRRGLAQEQTKGQVPKNLASNL